MATFDQLGPEERAVLELLLKRGRSYTSVAEMLDLKEERVAELAHAALADLTPVTSEAVEELDRGAIGNWVIGQATRGEAADARAALSREGAARAWAGSLLDALDGVASAGILPELPELERGGRARKAAGGADAADEGPRRFLVPGLGA
ncbi:MAG: sigma factor-like helix-turn-helix DNA-binding protein, partial [Thermoleophilaceae bacterium]